MISTLQLLGKYKLQIDSNGKETKPASIKEIRLLLHYIQHMEIIVNPILNKRWLKHLYFSAKTMYTKFQFISEISQTMYFSRTFHDT